MSQNWKPINERRGNRISSNRTNSERTYDQVKHNGHGGKKKKKVNAPKTGFSPLFRSNLAICLPSSLKGLHSTKPENLYIVYNGVINQVAATSSDPNTFS